MRAQTSFRTNSPRPEIRITRSRNRGSTQCQSGVCPANLLSRTSLAYCVRAKHAVVLIRVVPSIFNVSHCTENHSVNSS